MSKKLDKQPLEPDIHGELHSINETLQKQTDLEIKKYKEEREKNLSKKEEKTEEELEALKEEIIKNTELFNSMKENLQTKDEKEVEAEKQQLSSETFEKQKRLKDLKAGSVSNGLGSYFVEKSLKTFGTKGMKADVKAIEEARQAEILQLEKELQENYKRQDFMELATSNPSEVEKERVIARHSEKSLSKQNIEVEPKRETTNEKLKRQQKEEEQQQLEQKQVDTLITNKNITEKIAENEQTLLKDSEENNEYNEKILSELKNISFGDSSTDLGDDIGFERKTKSKKSRRGKRTRKSSRRVKPSKSISKATRVVKNGKSASKIGKVAKSAGSIMKTGKTLLSGAGALASSFGGEAVAAMASNPIGWGIAGALAVGAAGYGLYHLSIDDDSEDIFNTLEENGVVEHNFFGDSVVKDWTVVYCLSKKGIDALLRYDDWSKETTQTLQKLKKMDQKTREFLASEIKNGKLNVDKDGNLSMADESFLSDLKVSKLSVKSVETLLTSPIPKNKNLYDNDNYINDVIKEDIKEEKKLNSVLKSQPLNTSKNISGKTKINVIPKAGDSQIPVKNIQQMRQTQSVEQNTTQVSAPSTALTTINNTYNQESPFSKRPALIGAL